MNAALLKSENMSQRTPKVFLDLVRTFIGRRIDLDPCAHPEAIVDARTQWYGEWHVDGLKRSWADHGLAFCNPPYGRHMRQWSAKISAEARQGVEIIALTAARPDTRWFQDLLLPAARAVCFWKGRLTFLGEPSPAPFPSMVSYYGQEVERFRRIFSTRGSVFVLPHHQGSELAAGAA